MYAWKLCLESCFQLKSNTTLIFLQLAAWLHKNQVCSAKLFENEPTYFRKEVHYFGNKHRFVQGVNFYAKRFEDCYNAGEQFAMDATPATLYCAKQVYETYMEAGGNQAAKLKMILILRDPASRELSLYNHKKYVYARTQDQKIGRAHV